jgi:MFS family permease
VLDFLPALLVDLAIYLVIFTLQHVLDERLVAKGSRGSLELALFTGVYTTVYVIATPILGALTDRPGWRRKAIALGAFVTAIVPAAVLFEGGSVAALYAAMAAIGLGSALFWPALQARIGDRAGAEKRGAALARFNVGWTAGKALGLLVAGELNARGHGLALEVAAAAGLLCLLTSAFDRGPRGGPSAAAAVSVSPRAKEEKKRFLAAALVTNFAVWGSQATVIALVPVLGRELALGEVGQGRLLAALVTAQALTFLSLGAKSAWSYRAPLLLATAPLAAVASLALFLAPNVPCAVAGVIATGVLAGAAYAFSLFYSLDYDERRGFRTGVNEAVLGFGGLLPLAGSALADHLAMARLPWLSVALACALASLVAAGLLIPRDKRRTSSYNSRLPS